MLTLCSFLLCAIVASALIAEDNSTYIDGFINPSISQSSGGQANCVSGLVSVNITSSVVSGLNISGSMTSLEVVQTLELTSTNASSLIVNSTANNTLQSFNINSHLCFPANLTNTSEITKVQLLTHGIGFDHSYWDFSAPNNSYIDVATAAGYATFSYDRLGVGESDQPDPITVVQSALEQEILHTLVGYLRNGSVSAVKYTEVIGVGHSYGSQLTSAVATTYIDDFDSIVLTGYTFNGTGPGPFLPSLNLISASSSGSDRFPCLPSGYLVPGTPYGLQFGFFYYPNFDPAIFDQAYANVQTTTWGELLTMGGMGMVGQSNYTGPVLILNGEYDLPFCNGNCTSMNYTEQTLQGVFPNSKQPLTFLLDESGSAVNLHLNAPIAFEEILSFVSNNTVGGPNVGV